ncbi:MAG: zinc transporter ZupT [Bacteroidetes bacterium ADurb.Bin408]|nr:MAG: zinc transporter ZupT [Bacteroidetes bacterium ADurb.Bin408]
MVFFGLFLPVLIAGGSVYMFKINKIVLKLIVAFSGSYLLSLVFNELLPRIYNILAIQSLSDTQNNLIHNHEGHAPHYIIGLLILAGFFIQLLLDYLTKGIEHGHTGHPHIHEGKCEDNHIHHTSVIPVLIGLCLHSFLEGMPLADGLSNVNLQNRLLAGIIIHNIPISIVLVSLMLQFRFSMPKAFSFLMLFALASPAGALLTHFFGSQLMAGSDYFFNYIMAIVVGIFLHISTTILFETDEGHKFNILKFITMMVGVFAALIHF